MILCENNGIITRMTFTHLPCLTNPHKFCSYPSQSYVYSYLLKIQHHSLMSKLVRKNSCFFNLLGDIVPDPQPGTKPRPCSGTRAFVSSFSNKATRAGLGCPASHRVRPSCQRFSQSIWYHGLVLQGSTI
jgi:hypothetical protein